MSLRFRSLYPAVIGLSALLASGCQLVVPGGGQSIQEDEAGIEARACGNRTCEVGSVCCNASCGICTAPDNVCIQIACEPGDEDSCDDLRCGKREACMETPAGAQCVPDDENPCALVDCKPDSVCKVEQGAARCLPLASSDAGTSAPKDAGTTRDAGASTLDAGTTPAQDAGASAQDSATPAEDAGSAHDAGTKPKDSGVIVPISCAVVLCPANTYCDDIDGTAQCIPLPSCATVRCSAGHHCELEPVVCIRAPCPPQPRCVPDEPPGGDPCKGKCKNNTHCELLEIVCVTTPCEPVPTCVPDRVCGCSSSGPGKGAPCLDVICPVDQQN